MSLPCPNTQKGPGASTVPTGHTLVRPRRAASGVCSALPLASLCVCSAVCLPHPDSCPPRRRSHKLGLKPTACCVSPEPGDVLSSAGHSGPVSPPLQECPSVCRAGAVQLAHTCPADPPAACPRLQGYPSWTATQARRQPWVWTLSLQSGNAGPGQQGGAEVSGIRGRGCRIRVPLPLHSHQAPKLAVLSRPPQGQHRPQMPTGDRDPSWTPSGYYDGRRLPPLSQHLWLLFGVWGRPRPGTDTQVLRMR